MSGKSNPNYESTFPLLPLRGAVLFPGATVPFEIGRPKTTALAERVIAQELPYLVVFPQRVANVDDPGADDLYEHGTLARVAGVERQRKGTYAVVLEGVARVRLVAVESTTPFLEARVEPVDVPVVADDELAALGMSLRDATRGLLELLPGVPREIGERLLAIESPAELADYVRDVHGREVEEKVRLLAAAEPKARLREALRLIAHRAEVLKMRDKINTQVKDELGKTQREHVLRQQMKAIQEELGEDGEDEANELDELEKRVDDAKLSPEAAEVAKKQLKRLRGMTPQSPSSAWCGRTSTGSSTCRGSRARRPSRTSLAVRAVLDADHFGLEKVKKRILEYLAVRKLKSALPAAAAGPTTTKGPILCLIGPPGVGKTSLGKSIARALDRKFVRHLARRRARRGGDPRPPPHVHRRAPRADHPGDEEGRHGQPRLHARRDRQARQRLPGRPVVGAARGARSRAERHVRRPLPRDPLRSLEGRLRRDGERRRHHPRPASRPHGDHRDPRLHAQGEARHRQAPPPAQAARRARDDARSRSTSPTRRSRS